MGAILLPKKETPGQTPRSAQRINAGALLEQEQQVAQAPEPKLAPAEPAPPPKREEPTVPSLETYRGDIEKLVQEKNISVVSIAAAEAQRRGQTASQPESGVATPRSSKTFWVRAAMIAGGISIVALGAGLLVYALTPRSVQEAPGAPQAPFILVDTTQMVARAPGDSRTDFINKLDTARQRVLLSLGLIERLLPATASTTQSGAQNIPMDTQAFLSSIAPHVPQELLRNLNPTFLLGAHVYDSNQAFLILKVDSYEQGYSSMLAWEPDLPQDLAPLFNYTPRVHIPEENIATTAPVQAVLSTDFQDQIVENHDARVLKNSTGDIYLLWTFLDRNTLVITTNDATLREIISRLQNAPVTPIPGQ